MIDRQLPAHRPPGPNSGTQQWRDLLFLHWEVSANSLRGLVPRQLELDLFEGRAFISLVPYCMRSIRPRWWRFNRGFDFLEANVRTYVVHNHQPGVYFFSLDANSVLAVVAARVGWSLPYYPATMHFVRNRDEVVYDLRRWGSQAKMRVRYRIGESLGHSPTGTLDHFLLERYFLFLNRRGSLLQGQVHHAPYPVQHAEVLDFHDSTISAAGIACLDQPASLAHYSTGVDVEVFPLKSV